MFFIILVIIYNSTVCTDNILNIHLTQWFCIQRTMELTCYCIIYSYSFGSISEISITNVDCTNDYYQVILQCDVIYTGTCNAGMAVTVNCGKD